jgi:CheY-specific phosphatase CheX
MTPQVTPEPPLSEPARIAGVYFEPPKAFADIVARPGRWWVPMLLIILAALAFTYCYGQRVGWERMLRHELESNTQFQSLPAAQREQQIQTSLKITPIIGYAGPVVGTPIYMLIVAGILMLVMSSLMGAQVNFKQSLAIVAYSSLTGLVSLILSIVVMYIKNPEDFDIRNPLAFNGGAFLASDAPKWLTALASSFDVFSFWTMALLATGYAATTRKLKWSTAFAGVVMMWAVWVVLKTGWAALRG